MMASQSIIKLDVGGQIFQTTISTLAKYPGSMLSAMFHHTDAGMSPMPKTEAGHFFLDVNPKFFEIVLEWLRFGEIITDDPGLLKGAQLLANYFGLDRLLEKLEEVQKKSLMSANRKYYPDTIQLQTKSEIIMTVKTIKLKRVPESLIYRYLNGEDIYLPISCDKSRNFVLDDFRFCDLFDVNWKSLSSRIVWHAFRFLDSDSFHAIEGRQFQDRKGIVFDGINKIKEYLKMFGIYENAHYKVEEGTGLKRFCLHWNKEFIMKYYDPDNQMEK